MVNKRTAIFCVLNSTNKKIISCQIIHKYSDVYRDEFTFVENNSNGGFGGILGYFSNQFNIGFLTTGQDWYLVRFIIQDDYGSTYLIESNPINFRGIIDNLEKVIAFDQIIERNENGFVRGSLLFNIESTSGFKKHVLRESDSRYGNFIELHENEIVFKSSSGTSRTGTIKKQLYLPR